MERTLAIAAAVIAGQLACGAVHAQAQNDWTQVACSDSDLAYGAGGSCSTGSRDGKTATGEMVGAGRRFRFQETSAARRVFMSMQVSATTFKAYSAQASEEALRSMVGRSGTGWTTYGGFGNTGYMGFKREGWNCVAFDHADGGFKWILRGSLCQPGAIADNAAAVKAILASTRVGSVSSAKNAFGGALVAPK